MATKTEKSKSAKRPGLWGHLTGKAKLQNEKSRLEAFLAAVPGAWCGFAADGTVAYNEHFCEALGLSAVVTITDIQGALAPSDAAVLEGLFTSLQDHGKGFAAIMHNADQSKTFRLTGARGKDAAGRARFDVLWLDDISADQTEQNKAAALRDAATAERNQLQTALDRMPFPLWLRNANGDLTWANRAYAQALEISPATVVAEQRELPVKPLARAGKGGAARVPGRALAQSALMNGATEETAGHVIFGGQRRLLKFTELALSNSTAGSAAMTLGIAQDTTREEELESTQARYAAANQELLEQLGSAIAIFDAGQKLEFYNSAFAQLWKLDDNYLNNHPKLGDLMEKLRETRQLPEQADFRKYKQSWLNMFTGLLQPHEEMMYLPGGSALRQLVVPHPMGGLMMTFEDVTSRLELESSYNTLIAVQRETLDNLAEGVAVYGGDGRLRLWNPAFARLWNLNPEDLAGNPHITRLAEKMRNRFRIEDWPRAQKALIAQTIDRTLQEGELGCADGAVLSYSAVPLPDGGVLVTHVDVTDTALVENALREKNAALEAAERLKLDFLANVSYQLRTPLSAIMGFTEILSNEYFGALNVRQREYTTGMQEAGERLLSLIDDILDLSTIEAGYMFLTREDVSVYSVLESITSLTRDWAKKENIEVQLDCPSDIGTVFADERRLKQAMLNLVSNAINFSTAGGIIRVNARRADNAVLLAVADNGSGIAAEDQKRIFLPFERAVRGAGPQELRRNARGAGLGLALVKNIVELHGGRVTLESHLGQGTTFTVALPDAAPLPEKTKTSLRVVK